MESESSTRNKFDGHYFDLNSKKESYCLVNNDSTSKLRHYLVQNIGRTLIKVEVWNCNKDTKIASDTIQAGETKVLNVRENRNSYLKVINVGDRRAIVHCKGGNLVSTNPSSKKDFTNISQYLSIQVVKYFAPPIITSLVLFLQEFFNYFWPDKKPNLWDEISCEVDRVLEKNNSEIIISFLKNELEMYRDKIHSLIEEFTENIEINQHYMAVAYDLIGIERKLQFSDKMHNYKKMNSAVLPLLIGVLSLKHIFYIIGVKFSKEMGLTENEILQLKKYSKDTYESASFYLEDLEKSCVDDCYNNSDPNDIFNHMMLTRQHFAVHALEYLPIWKYQMENLFSEGEIYNHVITYSTFFGKQTPMLYAQATGKEVPPPLCPKLINGRRNKLKTFSIYLWNDVVSGAKLFFENGDEYPMGINTSSMTTINMNESRILKITAYGEGKVHGLDFLLSDKRKLTAGLTNSRSNQEFSLKDHHIPSFFLGSDSISLVGQAANFAVSFQWYGAPKSIV